MGTISVTAAVAGQTLTASFYNTNLNNILNQCNGNLDATNLKDGAVTTAKIASRAVTEPKIDTGFVNALTTVSAASGDYVALSDVSDSNLNKKALISDIMTLAAGGVLGSAKNLNIVRDSATQVTVTADELILEDSSNNKVTIRSVSEAIAITTSGASGLDTGAEASNTWYYIWIIRKSSDGTVNGLLSASSSSPTLPTGYDQKALVGAVRNDNSSNFLNFTQTGRIYRYATGQIIVSAGTGSAISNISGETAAASATGTNKLSPGVEGAYLWRFPVITADTLYYGNSGGNISTSLDISSLVPSAISTLVNGSFHITGGTINIYVHGFEINKLS